MFKTRASQSNFRIKPSKTESFVARQLFMALDLELDLKVPVPGPGTNPDLCCPRGTGEIPEFYNPLVVF